MTNKVYLLDANVLIALSAPTHSLNSRAAAWFLQNHRFATCPITEGRTRQVPPARGNRRHCGIGPASAETRL
jgi:predicted nucleic acid-binding protein